MIKEKTVLVLGAGASKPYGFPTGSELMEKICLDLSNKQQRDEKIFKELGFKDDDWNHFIYTLIHSGRSSIDTFLETRQEFIDIGKTAIALILLPCEKKTMTVILLYQMRKPKFKKVVKGSWYQHLFNVLTEGHQFEELDLSNLSIVTFNYERSIENYLFQSLTNSYGKTADKIIEVLNQINIVHVHGSLGPLDWDVIRRDYGKPLTVDTIQQAVWYIQVLHEGQKESPEFDKARQLIKDARCIYFLGFGYHPVNIYRLGLEDIPSPTNDKIVSGTTRGLSADRKAQIRKNNFLRCGNLGREFYETDVYSFFHDHIRLI
jgi:hypothetical protein